MKLVPSTQFTWRKFNYLFNISRYNLSTNFPLSLLEHFNFFDVEKQHRIFISIFYVIYQYKEPQNCWGCGIFGIWDNGFAGCLRYGISRMRNVEWGMWNFAGMRPVGLHSTKLLCLHSDITLLRYYNLK